MARRESLNGHATIPILIGHGDMIVCCAIIRRGDYAKR
jgi:hypothetical protein